MAKSIENMDIKNFLPHRKPMLMVRKLLQLDESSVTTDYKIDEDCIFVENNTLSETGLIENAAQVCSSIVGQSFFLDDDLEGKSNSLLGYISAIKKVSIYKLPKVGDVLHTKAKLVSRVDTDTMCLCTIESETFVNEECVVQSRFNFLIHEA